MSDVRRRNVRLGRLLALGALVLPVATALIYLWWTHGGEEDIEPWDERVVGVDDGVRSRDGQPG